MKKTKCKRGGKGTCSNEKRKAFKVSHRLSAELCNLSKLGGSSSSGTCSNEKRKASKVSHGPSPGLGNLSKLGDSSSSELCKHVASGVSKSVVSIASYIGDEVIYECTGVIIEGSSCADATSILTAANSVASPHMLITDDMMIKVRLPNDQVVAGWLNIYDINYGLAVVNIRRVCDFQSVDLSSSHHMQCEPNLKVVAVGRCFNSGMLKSTNGIVICSLAKELFEQISTCKFDRAWIGGPLLDFEGNFVGMNRMCGEKTAFVPKIKILECLELASRPAPKDGPLLEAPDLTLLLYRYNWAN